VTGVRYRCIGSGTCVPCESRGPACHLLDAHGLRLLLDLGSGSLRTLARLGEPLSELHGVGVSHRHQDHVGDLLPLLFALRYVPEMRRSEPLELFGYPGLRGDLARLAEIYGPWVVNPGFELRVRELRPGETLRLTAGEARAEVTAHAVRHSPEAVGFRIRLWSDTAPEAARVSCVVSYSGDTGPTPELVDLARGADLFVCECAFPDGEEVPGHMTPSALLEVCAAAAPRRVVATHFYPVWDERGVERLWAEALGDASRGAAITPAHDGLLIHLSGDDAC
jgi:ribonuclease BN (tRNA processing enzyme)